MTKPTYKQLDELADELQNAKTLNDYQQGVLDVLLWTLGFANEPDIGDLET